MKLRRFELMIGLVCFLGGLGLIVYDFFQNTSEDSEKISLQIPQSQQENVEDIKEKRILFLNAFNRTKTSHKEIVVKKSEPFLAFLRRHGLSANDAKKIQTALRPYYKDGFLKRGQRFYINTEKDNKNISRIKKVVFLLPPGKKISLVQKEDTLVLAKKPDLLPKKLLYIKGSIKDSLYVDGLKAGLSRSAINNLTQQFSYSIDMQRALRQGDSFEVIVERAYDTETGFVDPGSVLYASLNTRSGPQRIYRFSLGDNQIEYFNEKGQGIKKALLKTPVRGARLSSRFGMRHHPIQGYTKMHRGIDFAAPSGTPIFAAGNGYIRKRGYLGSYGNYILIQHNKDYASAYAHMSRFSPKLGKGSRVSQGQVIGYIGTTGRSTGPHLHYEIHYKGKQVNPQKVQMPSQRNLTGTKYQDFLTHLKFIQSQRNSLKYKY